MEEGYTLAEAAAIYWQTVRELRQRAESGDEYARALLELIDEVKRLAKGKDEPG